MAAFGGFSGGGQGKSLECRLKDGINIKSTSKTCVSWLLFNRILGWCRRLV
jgi:hypothetical protein